MPDPGPAGAFEHLRASALLEGLDDAAVAALAARVRRLRCARGEALLDIGQPNRALYLVEQGRLAIELADASGRLHRVSELGAGEVVGEMSFIDADASAASARVEALDAVTVLRLDREQVVDPRAQALLARNIARAVTGRLRARSDDLAASLTRQLRESEMRRRFGQLYVLTLAVYMVAGLQVNRVDTSFWEQMAYSWGFLLAMLALVGVFVHRQGVPLARFGLTLVGGRRALVEGLAVTGAAGLAFAAIRAATLPEGEAFFSWARSAEIQQNAPLFALSYLAHSFIQEFMARGVFQGSLSIFMAELHWSLPVAIAAFLFASAHVFLGGLAVLLTFLVSFVFGSLYHRHGNLLGIGLAHFLLGLGAIAVGWI